MQLGYVILYVPDVAAAVAFYETAFGLHCRFVHGDEYGELTTGATTLAFASEEMGRRNGVTVRPSRPTDPAAAAVELAFVTDDPYAAFDRAVEAGAWPVAAPAVKPWGQTVAYVRDANGFLVELCSPVGPA